MNFSNKYEIRNNQLRDLIERSDFKGYSLYDSNNGVIDFTKFGHTINFVVNQIVKRGPSWTRKLLGIKKGVNPKLLGLYLLYSNEPKQVKRAIDLALSRRNEDRAWGYNYTWPRGDGSLIEEGRSNVVVTYFVFMGLLKHQHLIQNFDIVREDILCFIDSLVLYERNDEACFSYFPHISNRTLNASLFAVELLLSIDDSARVRERAQQCVLFVTNRQNKDGSFPYSENTSNLSLKSQYDFHQYYILASLNRISEKLGVNTYDKHINLGLEYLMDKQLDEGKFLWRVPKRYPIDIHNQAAAILTLKLFKNQITELGYDAEKELTKVNLWTESNMWSGVGYYYQYYPLIKIKTNYLRWNQGWMLAATSSSHSYSI